jgi:flagellar biosynthesis protein
MKEPNPKAAKAAALKYDGENAPTLVAKGYGQLAEKIIETAKQNEVHIHNDPLLLEVLARLDLGDEIPEPLYIAVAKIIAFAYFLQGKCPQSDSQNSATQNQNLVENQSQSDLADVNNPSK